MTTQAAASTSRVGSHFSVEVDDDFQRREATMNGADDDVKRKQAINLSASNCRSKVRSLNCFGGGCSKSGRHRQEKKETKKLKISFYILRLKLNSIERKALKVFFRPEKRRTATATRSNLFRSMPARERRERAEKKNQHGRLDSSPMCRKKIDFAGWLLFPSLFSFFLSLSPISLSLSLSRQSVASAAAAIFLLSGTSDATRRAQASSVVGQKAYLLRGVRFVKE